MSSRESLVIVVRKDDNWKKKKFGIRRRERNKVLNFCNFNQQMHTTVIIFTIIYLKTLTPTCFGPYSSIIRQYINECTRRSRYTSVRDLWVSWRWLFKGTAFWDVRPWSLVYLLDHTASDPRTQKSWYRLPRLQNWVAYIARRRGDVVRLAFAAFWS
jgi:hypothetical protein